MKSKQLHSCQKITKILVDLGILHDTRKWSVIYCNTASGVMWTDTNSERVRILLSLEYRTPGKDR